MQGPADSLFLLVLCERKPAKTENVRTDARDGTCGIRVARPRAPQSIGPLPAALFLGS
jgi:hypothetical protein